jgi:hypothetical protein
LKKFPIKEIEIENNSSISFVWDPATVEVITSEKWPDDITGIE